MRKDSKPNQVASATKGYVKELLGRHVLFKIVVGVVVKKIKTEKGIIIRLTDTGAIIKNINNASLHNRPWDEIQGLEDMAAPAAGVQA
jgi:hypothetical protein